MNWRLALAQVSASWCLLAVFEVFAVTVIPGTALQNDQLTILTRISIASYDLVILAVVILMVAAALRLLSLFGQVARRCRLIVLVLRTALVLAMVTLYIASWTLFWSNELFIGAATAAFWWSTPVQVFHWVPAYLIAVVLVLGAVLTALLRGWLPYWVAARSSATQSGLSVTASALLVVCITLALSGVYPSRGSDARVYAFHRDYRGGPFAHAFASLLRRRQTLLELKEHSPVAVKRRPVISMDQYVAGVDRSKVKRWNVIVIHIESLRSDQLRTYGGERDVMPALDALARKSRVYTDAFVQASHSNYANPVSLSSHYPLRSPTSHIYPKNPSYPRVLIYDILKALGYRTAVFSSSNENWMGIINYLRTGNIDRFFYPETFDGPTYLMEGDSAFARWVAETKHAGTIDDRFTVDEAIEWITGLEGAPFFMYLHLQSSHVPYWIPDDFPRRFGPKERDFRIMWGKFPRDKTEVVKDIYADSLFYVDTHLERLFAQLTRLGLLERTIIVVGGDNGEAFYEHGFTSHASLLYNEVVKVPLVVYSPGLSPGVDDRPAQHLDIPPTILDILGLPPHPSFQGISLLGSAPDPDRPRFIVVQTPAAHQYAIVRSKFKLIFDARSKQMVLFDLASDPGERISLALDQPARVRELAGQLDAWIRLQLSYYGDKTAHAREYPPILK